MKFATFLTAAAALLSYSNAFTLIVKDDGSEYDGLHLSSYPDGTNYGPVFLSDNNPTDFTYEGTLNVTDDESAALGVYQNQVEIGARADTKVSLHNHVFTYNGTSDCFRACTEVTAYQPGPFILFSKDEEYFAGKGCTPIRLEAAW
ncbi:hypothetical protein HYPBUDRAFT_153872 [Hyphopichia burtonii NRRL Y-1933]|uniref:Hyphally-regulated cell wall protein N-terminal domain-containing protein n=1 Tax=Hyphopichia burtonii NRRL Y-1933 TaxID=984485 RepID=A0A1E4REI3_9ASCO|nr:hypothetical protein HYPBUDRAFT_153872 [Hyphopichia burtonii NRRL Y-1933]ODV65678.1 hypothetical protein HYPBUDRAFT_153872 [Hyphopichia burtonii NRRL Y-1933]